ncbi:right-handed parallel beta-helix repeat-containing protein [Streptomonospora sp. PA3]|uniref:right-handed parallel beta-helix repeat-containing protein n=1 Tax=Streptomonospora sp. PA3 TaxID=2607326 RepID=UPI0016425279|nr:right-handed parallel beta-helix repeat-containing protein [Streptomonospora sp. PA3]
MARTYRRGTWRAETQDGTPIPYAQATVWDAADGGSQVTDLRQLDGVTVIPDGILTCDEWGYIALDGWVDPADTPHLYIIGAPDGVIPGVGRVHLVPADVSPRIASVETQQAGTDARVSALEDSRGAPGGLATLDADGQVPTAQLPESLAGGVTGMLDVSAYGAVGDGATDDTAAIQAALDDAGAAGGGLVWVPGGVYSVQTGPLRIYQGTHLWLAPDATIRRDAATTMIVNGDAGQSLGGYDGHGDITISGGTWDANGASITDNNMAISIGHARNVTIRDLRILDVPGYHGVELNSTHTGRVINCSFLGFTDFSGTRGFSEAVQVDGAYRSSVFGAFGPYDHTACIDILIQGCYVGPSGTPGAGPWGRGIGSHSTAPDQPHRNIRVISNEIDSCGEYAVGAYCWAESIVSGNTIRSCGAGIWWRSLDSTKSADQQYPDGTSITGSQPLPGIVISGNVITGTGAHNDGITLEGESTGALQYATVTGNMLLNIDPTGVENGIRLIHLHDSTITGNTLRSVGGTGISTEACDGVTISSNRLRAINGAGITLIDSLSGCVVDGNTLTLIGENGLWAQGGNDVVWSGNVIVGAAAGGGTYYGIRITSFASHHTVSGNRIRQGAGAITDAISITSSCDHIKVWGTHADAGRIVVPSMNGTSETWNSTTSANQPAAVTS